MEILETKMGRVERTVNGCVNSCEFFNAAYEEQKIELKNAI